MNIYLFDTSHCKANAFKELIEDLKVKQIYCLDSNIKESIKNICKDLIALNMPLTDGIHLLSNVTKGNKSVYKFVDQLIDEKGNLKDFYEKSCNNALKNLKNSELDDDPNLLILLPKISYGEKSDGHFGGISNFPKHFAQYSLNILRKGRDDRYAKRLAFLWIDSYLGPCEMYIRKNVINRYNEEKVLVLPCYFRHQMAVTKYFLMNMVERLYGNAISINPCTNAKWTFKDAILHYIEETDYKKYLEVKKQFADEKEKREIEMQKEHFDENEWHKELDDMYRGAFDGELENEWNID